jgi:hypothetical protein
MKKFTRWQTYLAGFSLGAVALLASCADGADRNGIFEPEVASLDSHGADRYGIELTRSP